MNKKKALLVIALTLAVALLLTGCTEGIRFMLAEKLFEKGQYEDALKLYESIPDHDGAAERIVECTAALSYAEAQTLMESGDYTAAAEAFGLCGDYLDATEKKTECENEAAYAEAKRAYDAGDYYAAAAGFAPLKGFSDADEYIEECEAHMPIRLVAHEDISPETIESVFGTFALTRTFTSTAGLGAVTDIGVSNLPDGYITIMVRGLANEDFAADTPMYELITGCSVEIGGESYAVGVVMQYGLEEHYFELFFGIPESCKDQDFTLCYTAPDGSAQTLPVDPSLVLTGVEYAEQVVQPFLDN